MLRFFRSTSGVYESVRAALDAAWGHPNPTAQTCITPADQAPHDSDGMVLLAVWTQFCEMPEVAAMLPDLLTSGAVEEISEQQYFAAIPEQAA